MRSHEHDMGYIISLHFSIHFVGLHVISQAYFMLNLIPQK